MSPGWMGGGSRWEMDGEDDLCVCSGMMWRTDDLFLYQGRREGTEGREVVFSRGCDERWMWMWIGRCLVSKMRSRERDG